MGDFYKNRGGSGYRGGGGGYRGSRRGGGDWRGSGGRGGFSSSRGDRGGGYRSNFSNASPSSYDSRSRSTYGSMPSDKFSRPRNDDYHGSSSSYSRELDYGRDDHRRTSPEPPRKRGRPDSSPSYMGSRRSNERSYSSGEYQGRSYVDKSGPGGGYLTEKGSYREVRESKPDYVFRKPAYTPRGAGGGFRGRGNVRSWRGTSRGRGFKSTTSYLARKRMETIGVRKRVSGRTAYLRRLTQFRQKRVGEELNHFHENPPNLPFAPPPSVHPPQSPRFARDEAKKSDDEEDEDEEDEEMGEEEEEEEEIEDIIGGVEEEEEDLEDEEVEEKEGDVDEGEIEGEEEKEDVKAATVEEKESTDGEKKEEDGVAVEKKKEAEPSPKKKVVVKKKVVTKKVVKKTAASKDKVKTEGTKGKEDDEAEGGKEEGDGKSRMNSRGQPFIRLKCPHCHYMCVTFNEYSRHLTTKKHLTAMKGLSTKLRSKLTTMRITQRKKQRALDEEAKANNLKLKTFFCPTCKLNYRTLKSDHFQSPEHKKIREFLAPFCKICKLAFISPWAYENHVSELLHIKRKAKSGEKVKKLDLEDIDLDPSSFMVLDAVGSGDEDEETDKSGGEENKEGETPKEEGSSDKKKKKKEEIKLGAEHCKLVEVYFCELCKIYLPRAEDKEKGLTYHCRSRAHLERYVRHRDDQSLRRRAVRLHKELEKEKEKEIEKEKELEKKKAPKEEGEEKKEEDKSWSEVDKDLSDLLHDEEPAPEVAPEAGDDDHPEDDDDDSRQEGERYDRFKQSEKADKEGGKTPAAPNGSLSTDEIKKIDPAKEEK